MVWFNCFIFSVDDLIDRDIELTECGIVCKYMWLLQEEAGFKLHYPLYLAKCGLEVFF